jgi:adenylate kinase family enzyme
MRLVVWGGPGAFGDDHAESIGDGLGLTTVSLGGTLRRHARERTDLGTRMKRHMDANEPVAPELLVEAVAGALDEAIGGWVLADFPRSIEQSELLSRRGHAPDAVIEISLSDVECLDAVNWPRTCGDCGHESVRFRNAQPTCCERCDGRFLPQRDARLTELRAGLAFYEDRTRELRERYQAIGILHRVPGAGGDDDVAARLRDVIGALIRRHG